MQPQSAQVANARRLIIELGQLLTDITAGQDVAVVHQRLLDLFDAAEHDGRVDAMEVGRREFAHVWSALRHGSALPVAAWEGVVLPTVVAFSSARTVKIHLELATTYWLAARAAVDAVPDYPAAVATLAAPEPAATSHAAPPEAMWPAAAPLRPSVGGGVVDPAPAAGAGRARTGPDRRVLVAVAVAVLATVTVMLVLLNRPAGDDLAVSGATASPSLSSGMMTSDVGPPAVLPTTPPTASPQPSPIITAAPMPAPSWTPPAPPTTSPGAPPPPPPPPVPPSAPTRLTAVAADEHNIWLSWSPPADGGSGGVAFYRVQRDGRFLGWTSDTSVTITGLEPGTSYTFVVYARNAAGLQSGPSNKITATTASRPSPPPSPPSSPSAPAPSSAEPPPPSQTPAEPSPSATEPVPPSTEVSPPETPPLDPTGATTAPVSPSGEAAADRL